MADIDNKDEEVIVRSNRRGEDEDEGREDHKLTQSQTRSVVKVLRPPFALTLTLSLDINKLHRNKLNLIF